MKRSLHGILFILMLVLSAHQLQGQIMIQDDFNYTAGTDLSANGWTKAALVWNAVTVTSPGLTYQGYIGAGVGNAALLTDYTERYSKSITVPATGNLYAAFMIRVDTATTGGGYVVCFYSNNAARGRFWIKNDGAGNLKFGLSGKSASATVAYDAANYTFKTTYLVVLKYAIVAGTTNDTYSLIVNPLPGKAEPTANIGPNTDAGSDLGANVAGASLSIQGRDSLGTGAVFVLDGIRVGTVWSAVMPPPPFYYNGTGAVDDVNSWGDNTNGTGNHPADFGLDNQLYLLTNTASATLTSAWVVSGTESKVIIAGGTSLTIGSGGVLSAIVDVASGGVLNITNADFLPVFGTNGGTINFDNPAGITLTQDVVLPSGSGFYVLANGNLNVGSNKLTVKGRLRCNNNKVIGNGTFVLDSAGTLAIYSPDGIVTTGAAGDIQTTTRSFSRYGNYIYSCPTNQVTGNAIPDTVANITSANGNRNVTTSLSKSLVVTGNLTMTSGKYKLGNFNLIFSNPSGHSDTSYVITDGTGMLVRTVVNTGKKTMPVGSASEYRPGVFTFELTPAAVRNIGFRFITGDTGSVGFPSNIFYRYKGGYWGIASDSSINPTFRLDIVAPNGFADPATRRIIYRTNNSSKWDTVGTIPAFAADTVTQAGVDKFGQFAIGVGTPQTPGTGKRYDSEVFASYQIQSAIQYGTDVKQTLDLYTGAGDTKVERPLVLFIPGGGFKAVNAPGGFSNIFAGGLAKRGYVVANINYYRTTSNQPTDSASFEIMMKAQQDVKAAIRFLRKNGTAYGIDTSQIFLSGSSAGSITALHIAYLDSAEVTPNSVNWSSIGGTFDGPERGTPGVSTRVSGVIANWGAIGDTAWMKNSKIPVFCVHGLTDSTVFYDLIPADGPFKYSSKYIYATAQARGITSGLKTFANTGHTLDNDAAKQDEAYKASVTWLYSLLKASTIASVETPIMVPTEVALANNYPNPFNPSTTIRYQLPAMMNVKIGVYNILGQEIMTLVNEVKDAGNYSVTFDASHLSSGLYLYRLKAGGVVQTKKMLLLK
ncbi:MAG: T9SS type A sorting domain-containing protein [Bacteroidota bacterium]